MNPIAIRLLNQQLVSPLYAEPADVVSHMGAVQAQEYRMMRWAVAMRTQKPSHETFQRDYDNGRIIRVHLFRGTWQLIASEDYHWMMPLCALKAISITKGWMHSQGIDISDKEIATVGDILCRVAEERESATKEDFAKALIRSGMAMDDRRLVFHLRMAEYNGLICSGELRPMKATYSLTSRRIAPHPSFSKEEALCMLARKYFQSHSPATLEDFVWWSGLNTGDCRKGIQAIGDELQGELWQGRMYYLHESCRTRGFRKGQSLLLPSYDEYLIAYKSRDIVLPAEHRHRAHNNSGIFYPVIARDGIICGNWKPFEDPLEIISFVPDNELEGLDKEWKRYKRFGKI